MDLTTRLTGYYASNPPSHMVDDGETDMTKDEEARVEAMLKSLEAWDNWCPERVEFFNFYWTVVFPIIIFCTVSFAIVSLLAACIFVEPNQEWHDAFQLASLCWIVSGTIVFLSRLLRKKRSADDV